MLATKNAWCPTTVGHDLRVHNMFEERPHRCHLSAPVKKPKRKFSSSSPGLKVATQALKSWMFARSLFLHSHDFRTLSTFLPGFCYEGTTRKSRACIIPISMAAKCTKPIFELAWLITLLPSMWYWKSFPIFNSSIFAIFLCVQKSMEPRLDNLMGATV